MQIGSKHIAKAQIEAVITRADGTVEHLGVIDSYKRPWWRTMFSKLFKD